MTLIKLDIPKDYARAFLKFKPFKTYYKFNDIEVKVQLEDEEITSMLYYRGYLIAEFKCKDYSSRFKFKDPQNIYYTLELRLNNSPKDIRVVHIYNKILKLARKYFKLNDDIKVFPSEPYESSFNHYYVVVNGRKYRESKYTTDIITTQTPIGYLTIRVTARPFTYLNDSEELQKQFTEYTKLLSEFLRLYKSVRDQPYLDRRLILFRDVILKEDSYDEYGIWTDLNIDILTERLRDAVDVFKYILIPRAKELLVMEAILNA
jgi:hypothetical protein